VGLLCECSTVLCSIVRCVIYHDLTLSSGSCKCPESGYLLQTLLSKWRTVFVCKVLLQVDTMAYLSRAVSCGVSMMTP